MHWPLQLTYDQARVKALVSTADQDTDAAIQPSVGATSSGDLVAPAPVPIPQLDPFDDPDAYFSEDDL